MAQHKKLTADEFKRRVKVALTGPLPGANGPRRLQPRASGEIQKLLKGTQTKRPVQEPPIGGKDGTVGRKLPSV